jgi:DNA-binding MarR family transcriptional regulator
VNDLIQHLGPLAFASRLKRLAEQLQRDVSRVYEQLDMDVEARWFPVLFLLSENKRLAVTEIADRLGMTHPSVNQIAGAMSRHGLLASSKDRNDERRRLLSLSAKGRRTVEKLQPVWKAVSDETGALLNESRCDILDEISRLESSLAAHSMFDRIAGSLGIEKNPRQKNKRTESSTAKP